MFTSKLGTSDSRLGNIKLGLSGGGGGGGSSYDNSINISAISSTILVGGIDFYKTFELLTTSSIIILPGISYDDMLDIDGEASLDTSETYFKNESISIDAEASIDVTFLPTLAGNLILNSIASLTIATIQDYEIIFGAIAGRSFIDVETFYNNLLDVVVVNTLTIDDDHLIVDDDTPLAISGMNITAEAIYNRVINQTFTINQNAHINPDEKESTNTINFIQTVSLQLIHNLIASNTLVFTQEALRIFSAQNTINFAQQVSYFKVFIKSITQTLNITQSVNRLSTYNRTLNHTYTPYHGGTKVVPIIGTDDIFNYVESPAYVSVTPKKCRVILKNNFATLILPCPQLGDSQNYLGTLNLKRTMTGDTFTYVRRSQLNSFNYTFWLGRLKTLEVENFLFTYGDQIHRLYNFKGEEWIVKITNTPFQFIGKERYQPQGERYEVNIEFTGTKIGG